MECMCAQTGPRLILSSERVLGNGVRTYVNSKGKIPSTGKNLRGGSNPRRCIKQDSEPNTKPTHCPLSNSCPCTILQTLFEAMPPIELMTVPPSGITISSAYLSPGQETLAGLCLKI